MASKKKKAKMTREQVETYVVSLLRQVFKSDDAVVVLVRRDF